MVPSPWTPQAEVQAVSNSLLNSHPLMDSHQASLDLGKLLMQTPDAVVGCLGGEFWSAGHLEHGAEGGRVTDFLDTPLLALQNPSPQGSP